MNKKKSLKIVKSELLKKQEKQLSKDMKKELGKVLEKIAKNPTKLSHTMNVFGPASPEELKQWMGKTCAASIDLVMEYLKDKKCLNKKGQTLAYNYWKKYVKK